MADKVIGLESRLILDNFRRPFFHVKCSMKKGSVVQKTISLEDYRTMLGIVSREVKEKYILLPPLPQGYYCGGLGTKNGSFWVALHVPSGKHQYVVAHTNEVFHQPYPGLLFLLEAKKGNWVNQLVYALADHEPTECSILYHYPYGHVSGRGSICMGSCIKKEANFSTAHSFVEEFFLGKDAGHSYGPGKNAKPVIPLRELVLSVQKKGEFPIDWLIPVSQKNTKLTVKEAINNLQGKY